MNFHEIVKLLTVLDWSLLLRVCVCVCIMQMWHTDFHVRASRL